MRSVYASAFIALVFWIGLYIRERRNRRPYIASVRPSPEELTDRDCNVIPSCAIVIALKSRRQE